MRLRSDDAACASRDGAQQFFNTLYSITDMYQKERGMQSIINILILID